MNQENDIPKVSEKLVRDDTPQLKKVDIALKNREEIVLSNEDQKADEREMMQEKINNLTDLISKLQDENMRLERELKSYKMSANRPLSRTDQKTMSETDGNSDDLWSRFKKWYNE